MAKKRNCRKKKLGKEEEREGENRGLGYSVLALRSFFLPQ